MASQSRNAKGAGRPIQYDRAAAIDAATQLFFDKGFRDTSVQDVVAATGMQTGSVYAAFGSKLALFLECLDRELLDLYERLEQLNADTDGDPLDALLTFWRVRIDAVMKPSFAARALMDFNDRSSEVWQRVSKAWAASDRAIQDKLTRAQAAGQVRRDLDVITLEMHVTALIIGGRFLRHYVCEEGECVELPSEKTLLDFLQPRPEA